MSSTQNLESGSERSRPMTQVYIQLRGLRATHGNGLRVSCLTQRKEADGFDTLVELGRTGVSSKADPHFDQAFELWDEASGKHGAVELHFHVRSVALVPSKRRGGHDDQDAARGAEAAALRGCATAERALASSQSVLCGVTGVEGVPPGPAGEGASVGSGGVCAEGAGETVGIARIMSDELRRCGLGFAKEGAAIALPLLTTAGQPLPSTMLHCWVHAGCSTRARLPLPTNEAESNMRLQLVHAWECAYELRPATQPSVSALRVRWRNCAPVPLSVRGTSLLLPERALYCERPMPSLALLPVRVPPGGIYHALYWLESMDQRPGTDSGADCSSSKHARELPPDARQGDSQRERGLRLKSRCEALIHFAIDAKAACATVDTGLGGAFEHRCADDASGGVCGAAPASEIRADALDGRSATELHEYVSGTGTDARDGCMGPLEPLPRALAAFTRDESVSACRLAAATLPMCDGAAVSIALASAGATLVQAQPIRLRRAHRLSPFSLTVRELDPPQPRAGTLRTHR
eukprot:4930241-Pleurochrysis_carterae.AAC.5